MKYREIKGDLIKLALEGEFDVIAHGCNCFCTMGAGLAPQMAKAFACDRYDLEGKAHYGDINKLGQIDTGYYRIDKGPNLGKHFFIINAYTQFGWSKSGDKPIDYDALTLCLRKINYKYPGAHVGLPQIGCGLAGGDWDIVEAIIKNELTQCEVTVVIYQPQYATQDENKTQATA